MKQQSNLVRSARYAGWVSSMMLTTIIAAGCSSGIVQIPQHFLYWDTNYETVRELDKEIGLYYRGISRPSEYEIIVHGEERARGTTCESASLKALVALQATARKIGADAIINLSPSWEGKPLTDEEGVSYTCEIGFAGKAYGVEWEGDFVKVTDPAVVSFGKSVAEEKEYTYSFEPSSPQLEDVEREIVETVLAAPWSESGPSNYEAVDKQSPGGVWTARPVETTMYEVVYTLGDRSWHWTVNLNSNEVTFVEIED